MATPLEIEILMHYATRGGDYRNGDFTAPSVRSAIDGMLESGLLTYIDHPVRLSGTEPQYSATDGARLYIEALQAVPFPVRRWEIPGTAPATRATQ